MQKVRVDSQNRIVHSGIDKRHANHILLSTEEFTQIKAELFQEIASGDMEHRKWLKNKIEEFFELRFNGN